VEPGKTSIARQRLSKQVSVVTDTQGTINEFLGKMFSTWSLQSGYKQELI
jgi:hypothetical protein